ncbi:MAG: hypothetical protein IJ217_01020 [Clostridia bacterium]|nr:hypothetical protein [Clostridia bacterium]
MKRKISVLTIAVILTLILFGISTYLQRKLINYEPTMKCYVASADIEEHEKVSMEKMKLLDVPIAMVMNMKIVQEKEDLNDLYAKSKVYAGQILVKNQFDTRESLSIFEGEEGKEKIAIRIKAAENGVSYRIKENSKVNVYATLRTEYSNNIFPNSARQYIGSENDGYCNMKILDNVRVIGVFDNVGMQVDGNTEEYTPDTIMVSVTPEEARDINLIRDVAVFSITELEEVHPAFSEPEVEEQAEVENEVIAEEALTNESVSD